MGDALETAIALQRAQAAIARRLDGDLGSRHGVSLTDFTVLVNLAGAPGGRLRRVDLADALGLTPSGVTRGLAPLERIGLVERETDPRDARVAYAKITDTGRARLKEMRKTAAHSAAEVFAASSWSTDRISSLRSMLSDLANGGRPGV